MRLVSRRGAEFAGRGYLADWHESVSLTTEDTENTEEKLKVTDRF
jgi:hypothetical protein